MLLVRRLTSIATLAAVLLVSLFAQTPQASPTQPTPQQQQHKSQPKCTNTGTYVNSKGETVKRPENCSAPLRELPPNVETEATASATGDEGHARITAVLPSGFVDGN